MARITIIPESEAKGELRAFYDQVSEKRGAVSEVLTVHSLLPETMKDHFKLYYTLMFEQRQTGITRKQLEMLAVTVSATNKCTYCVAHHSAPLRMLLKDEALLSALQNRDVLNLQKLLSSEDFALVLLAVKITSQPDTTSQEDIDNLRRHSFNDEQILHVVLVINYFNFVNRNVLALGVELESDYDKACK